MRNIVYASKVGGAKIKNLVNESKDKMRKVGINKTQGITAADFAGILGFGDKYSALSLEDCFRVKADKEYLRSTQSFESEHESLFAALDFVTIIKDYYKHFSYDE